MKQSIINRYEVTDKREVVVDVSIKSVEDLYHNFDKTAPYHRKELDQDLVDYIIECVQEVGKNPFIIRISLENMPGEELMERVQRSINGYYGYLKDIEIRAMNRMYRRFMILFIVGLVFLIFAILAARWSAGQEGVFAEVFAQGLTIAAWISLWEAIANIFLEWHPYRQNITLYDRIINAPVIFRNLP